jgi:hypothetical protein
MITGRIDVNNLESSFVEQLADPADVHSEKF